MCNSLPRCLRTSGQSHGGQVTVTDVRVDYATYSQPWLTEAYYLTLMTSEIAKLKIWKISLLKFSLLSIIALFFLTLSTLLAKIYMSLNSSIPVIYWILGFVTITNIILGYILRWGIMIINIKRHITYKIKTNKKKNLIPWQLWVQFLN